MKKLLKLFLLSFVALCVFTACGSGGASNMDKAVGSASYNYRTDWARFSLLGMPKTVEQNGYAMNFSSKGKFDDNDEPKTRFKGRVRTDIGYSGCSKYVFDELGRLVEQSADGYRAVFVYEEDHFYPLSKTEEIEDEFGAGTETVEHVYAYKAKDFDEEGNWLVRTDNGVKEERSISYYENPYAVKPQPRYKTPEEVAEAILKAEKKCDAAASYATLEPETRERFDMPFEKYKANVEASWKKDSHRLVSYKITGIEFENEGEAILNVDKTFADGSVYEYSEMLVRCDDGFWYSAGISGGQEKK